MNCMVAYLKQINDDIAMICRTLVDTLFNERVYNGMYEQQLYGISYRFHLKNRGLDISFFQQ